ncbi:MAG: FAD-dependent oxidoreductase [Planctomycetes bacterium]|nr:FAD-dependent oxidoreductase [Planctomycetota bacterium]MCH9775257.1 FAD-dependent oxidoreductase [Planctomycetota bacterium]
MKIAIIGGGISGLTAAYCLQKQHDITVFEANDYVGGHTNTIDLDLDGEHQDVDTGFIVFNYKTYPNFTKMLNQLGVASQPTEMSFSMKCASTGLEYRGADLNGMFAQRRNLFNFRFFRLMKDILRFNRQSVELLQSNDEEQTVGDYLAQERFSKEFIEQYFLPMGSAIWSCPLGTFEKFPVRFIVEFYLNHGILAIRDRPQWRVICGGSNTYVKALTSSFEESIRVNTPVVSITRGEQYVELCIPGSLPERFDHVIFACHSDQALKILDSGASSTELELLSEFPYESNVAQLHTDVSVLPHSRRAWACWNYFAPSESNEKATVTYNMNLLQNLSSKNTFCVTLNGEDRVDPKQVIRRINYAHPIFTAGRAQAQQRHAELINQQRTSFCGAYWGNGFHEDGVNSALAVCQSLLGSDGTWKAESTQVGFDINVINQWNTSFATEST